MNEYENELVLRQTLYKSAWPDYTENAGADLIELRNIEYWFRFK